jgi:cytochrome oxidase Cu insertion factor (SCO1/SenC/PrrC family)
MKKISVAVLAVAALALLAMAPVDDNPNVGQAAPAIAATDYEGNLVSLADFKGKVVMVVFWFPT